MCGMIDTNGGCLERMQLWHTGLWQSSVATYLKFSQKVEESTAAVSFESARDRLSFAPDSAIFLQMFACLPSASCVLLPCVATVSAAVALEPGTRCASKCMSQAVFPWQTMRWFCLCTQRCCILHGLLQSWIAWTINSWNSHCKRLPNIMCIGML